MARAVLSPGSPPSVPRRRSSRVPGQEERQPLPRSRGLREASVPSGKRWSGDRGFTLGASVIWWFRAYARLPPEPTSFPDTQGGASVSHAGISPQVLWKAGLNGNGKTACGGCFCPWRCCVCGFCDPARPRRLVCELRSRDSALCYSLAPKGPVASVQREGSPVPSLLEVPCCAACGILVPRPGIEPLVLATDHQRAPGPCFPRAVCPAACPRTVRPSFSSTSVSTASLPPCPALCRL